MDNPSHLTIPQFARKHDEPATRIADLVRSGKIPSIEVYWTKMIPVDSSVPARVYPQAKMERNEQIKVMRSKNDTMAKIALHFGITRQRVEQILRINKTVKEKK